MKNHFFAPCPRGLEGVLAQELSSIGAESAKASDGGVGFFGDYAVFYKANLESRIASRILWKLAEGHYKSDKDIYDGAFRIPWDRYFSPELTIKVKTSAIKCPLKSIDFVTLRIKDAVCDKFRQLQGKRPSIDTVSPDIRIHAHLTENSYAIYLDTSGEALFKRGLRKKAGEAPLKENLAAGILKLAGWTPGIPLLDPMCGSGTFLLEAAQTALNIAPGFQRNFAFEKFSNFNATLWRNLKEESRAQQKSVEKLGIFGSDLYGYALDNARANFLEAGLEGAVELKQANFLEISAPAEEGIIVTNPPYGVRIGEQEKLEEFYPKMGDVLKRKFAGWNAYIFTEDMRLAKLIRLSASRRMPLFNGALECRLFEYRIVSGGMRKP